MTCVYVCIPPVLPVGVHVFHLVDSAASVTFTKVAEMMKKVFLPSLTTCGEYVQFQCTPLNCYLQCIYSKIHSALQTWLYMNHILVY